MKNRKKRYPRYKELIKIKFENEKKFKGIEISKEISKLKVIAENFSETLDLSNEDVFNAMGLNRFNIKN